MERVTKQALTVGLISLVIVIPLFLTLGPATGRPLAAFAVPPLLTAVFGRWKPTVAIGVLSLFVGLIFGVISPMSAPAVIARMVVNPSLVACAAIVAARREREHQQLIEMAETSALYHVFEAGLLPEPEVPCGYDVVVRFISSQQRMALGGDLVDAVQLPDGRLAFVIGDVCGHGPREAAFATAVRAGWRTVVKTHRPDPAAWLTHLRRTLYPEDNTRPYVTMCTGIVDRASSEMTLALAGHPPPIAIGECAHPLVLRHGPPLGVESLSRWESHRVPVGSGLLLYTDGLVDNPAHVGRADRWGERGLVDWANSWSVLHAPPTTHEARSMFVDALIDTACHGRDIDDDLAVMVVAVDDDRRSRTRQGELIEVHRSS